MLDTFISSFALDLPKFINSSAKEKANTLLQIIGVGDQLAAFDNKESAAYTRRTEIGRIADQKKKYADEMPQWDSVPDEIVSASELIQKQQDILARNAQRQQWIRDSASLQEEAMRIEDKIEELKKQLHDINEKIRESDHSPAELAMESTEELEESISNIDAINAKVRDNLNKQKAEEDAKEYRDQYDKLTSDIETIRSNRMKLLNNAKMPLPGLSVDHGELTYKGQRWDNMSSSEQMIVATAIVRELNPKCGFVLLDKLEQMDVDTMNEFGAWLQKEGLQAIATRVSTGDECSIYIEDGYSIKNGVKT
ncbi:chromosome segregation protein SMC, partial [Galactobacillus timonensis]|uniref:chromosome segregation protein SMC n=1 Tax=Galactobacillus timonensis TaxID=2041840 RepID=UPI0010845D42